MAHPMDGHSQYLWTPLGRWGRDPLWFVCGPLWEVQLPFSRLPEGKLAVCTEPPAVYEGLGKRLRGAQVGLNWRGKTRASLWESMKSGVSPEIPTAREFLWSVFFLEYNSQAGLEG